MAFYGTPRCVTVTQVLPRMFRLADTESNCTHSPQLISTPSDFSLRIVDDRDDERNFSGFLAARATLDLKRAACAQHQPTSYAF